MPYFELKPIEAMQVPQREENEAAKDYEERLRKVAAWLDEKGYTEITFDIPKNDVALIVFKDERGAHGAASEGLWLVWKPAQGQMDFWSDESFKEAYQEVKSPSALADMVDSLTRSQIATWEDFTGPKEV